MEAPAWLAQLTSGVGITPKKIVAAAHRMQGTMIAMQRVPLGGAVAPSASSSASGEPPAIAGAGSAAGRIHIAAMTRR